MTKQTSTRRSLLVSVVALVCCFAMLLGTTFAWFTDSVSSEGNTIKSGTLKVDLSHKVGDRWISLKETAGHKVFDYEHWEPGYTRVEALKVENHGTLALQYKLSLSIAPGSEKTGPNGENLADVIHVYYTNTDATPANFAEIKSSWTDAGTLADVMNSPATFIGGQLTPDGEQGDEQLLTIALHMDENAGNEYQNLSVGNIYVNLVATQWTYEKDSFDENYDKDATFPGEFSASASVSVDANGKVDQATTVGEQDGIHADIPTGVKMANGATELTLDIQPMGGSQANITLDNGETKKSYDIHIDGIATDNTVPVQIKLPGFMKKGLNTTSVELYHVENGQTVAMTLVDNPVNHNEFSYDPATGDVVVAMASFSEVAVVSDVANAWDGTSAEAFNKGTGSEADPYMIANAQQFAYFRDQVDAGVSYEGQYIKLENDIDLSNVNFDPIGWGYVNTEYNRDGKAGCVFMGTFDGNDKTIRNLYQNGWELEEATGTDYTYTNCGFGLFAAAADATFKNLTITGAYVRAECVEMGILVGLSQGTCKYDNIKIYNSKIANYQRPAGGLIGEVSPVNGGGKTTIENVTIGSDVVVGSLWGDFDAPVGGVIGARWDDANTTKVVMKNVTVAARLDVYNDVTSTYQWYAYRRAGMLIGNTEQVADDGRTAAAGFLTCEKDSEGNDTVKVYYGNWVNYHYCEFNNHNSSWPFVRVEAGENCTAFSNPRWGVPYDINNVKVTPERHSKQDNSIHKEGDDCYVELTFNQLYGGGQGVYGQPKHDGVTIENLAYTITYVNDNKVLDVVYVTSNTDAYPTENKTAEEIVVEWVTSNIEGEVKFGGWMNAGSTKLSEIPENNQEDVVLYPYFLSPHTASFVDQNGNILAWCFFNEQDTDELTNTVSLATSKLPYLGEEYVFDYWEVRGTKSDGTTIKEEYNANNFTSYGTDVTIYPYYIYKGSLLLIPVDEDNDGDTDYYRVDASEITREGQDVVIPDYVNGVPVEVINSGAFDDGKLRDVYVPNTITQIGPNAFCKDDNGGFLDSGEFPQIQIIFDGTKAEWDKLPKESGWDDNIGTGSVIICTQEPTPGYYLQDGSNGFWGSGIKIDWKWQSGSYPDWYPRTTE